jgi:ATP sulfurylase
MNGGFSPLEGFMNEADYTKYVRLDDKIPFLLIFHQCRG